MSDFVCPQCLDFSRILDQPSGPPPALSSSSAPVLVDRVRCCHAPVHSGKARSSAGARHQIPATAARQRTVEQEQPRPCRIGNLWDPSRVAAAVGKIRIFEGRPRRQSSGPGASGSDEPDLIIVRTFPSVAEMDDRLIDSHSILQLEKMLRCLPQAARAETLRRSFQGAQEADNYQRFPDVTVNQWILDTNPEAFPDPYKLDKESIEEWVRKLKITTKLLCLMRRQLDEQNCKPCQELKRYFEEVAREYIKILRKAAFIFSNARWTASDKVQMLAIFHTLVDVLYTIMYLSSSGSELTENKVADILSNMVDAFKRILEQTANDKHVSQESDIHPSTCFLMQALEFFHHNRDMVKAVTDPGDYAVVFHKSWVSKLENDAKSIFRDEQDRQYIFILKNTYSVLQMKCCPRGFVSGDEQGRLDALIRQYIDIYVAKFWGPLLGRVSQNRPSHSSFKKFKKDFKDTCNRQRKWRVPAELKTELRDKIAGLIVSPSSQEYTVEHLKEEIRALFES